jgi:hypothetical protein
VIHEKHIPIVHEMHEKQVTEETMGTVFTESRTAPQVLIEIGKTEVIRETLPTKVEVESTL